MGLAAIDPHNHKVQYTEIYEIPKFGAKKPNSKQDTTIWKHQNLQKIVWPCPDDQIFLCNFSVFKWLHLSQN